ncbi:hypothetical protein BT96DRAFT_957507 [Gymnopus androsaceus JB14]|uniref:Helitron helicase-like domain-containing protein n=1 Tax=Gymnopus androsaceus JB14 TaxID=1447944 RepID=A0A6A4HKP5_9AGAR|nr:hypothetical protein BT96DRAFT_957507 [Gymnopus androsaceus JB14]
MFPTLFPLGIGGFEDHRRSPSVSLKAHASHLLDQAGRHFRYHAFYVFDCHLFTSFTVKSSYFPRIAPALLAVTPDILNSLADLMRGECRPSLFNSDQQNAFRLLGEVNTIAAHVPGSQAAKIGIRNEIRSYFGYFGMPHLFLTLNPSAIFYGDADVDLTLRRPLQNDLLKRSVRAYRVARDPVAASDFFDFMIKRTFDDLFGWDFSTCSSTEKGGLFGKLRAFYGVPELTDRGLDIPRTWLKSPGSMANQILSFLHVWKRTLMAIILFF